MSEIILFRPKAELDASENLRGFVDSCRNELTIFGAELPFDENTWDITESLSLKGLGNKRQRLIFSNLTTFKDKSPSPMPEPFLSFSKAYLRYMHGFRPTTAVTFRLSALRALEAALSENGMHPDPVKIDGHVLNRAAQIIGERYSVAAAYRIAGQLEMVAAFLSDNKLTEVPARWRNYLKRPGDAVRVGKEFDEQRQSKMPSEAALDALPKVFRLATEPVDIIVSSVAAILCSAPDRINEVLMLPENCEVWQKSGTNGDQAYGLRWWPAKGADPMIKWVVPSLAGIVQEAIGKIRKLTDEARRIAKWYEENPGQIYLGNGFEHFRQNELLSMSEVSEILGMNGSGSVNAWCKSNKVNVVGTGRTHLVRFADVEKAIIGMLPQSFPVLNKETGLKYSEALMILRVNEFGGQRATYRCMIAPVNINQINTGLGSRAKHGFGSVFTRLGFSGLDGNPIKVTTHQFRHYLNTLAQAGGLSQLDIAKWSGRKDVRQNAAYDHVTPGQMLQKIRDAIGDESQMFGPLAEIPKKVLIPRDEFARLKVPTAHTTDLGFCIHDYTMSPCQLHMDCINCGDLACVKGDTEKTRRLRQRLEEARDLLQHAEQASSDEYYGSDRWMEHHKSTVDRLSQLCSIMDDPNVPMGAVIQLSPPQVTAQLDDQSERLSSDEVSKVDKGLLLDVMASMGE